MDAVHAVLGPAQNVLKMHDGGAVRARPDVDQGLTSSWTPSDLLLTWIQSLSGHQSVNQIRCPSFVWFLVTQTRGKTFTEKSDLARQLASFRGASTIARVFFLQ